MRNIQKIGQLVANIREVKGMTQAELARAIGTSQSAVARIESGEQNLSMTMLNKISKALKREIVSLSSGTINLKIEGGKKLKGEITTNAAKNSAMVLLAAALLNKGITRLNNVPKIEEVKRMIEVLESIGVEIERREQNLIITTPKTFKLQHINKEAAVKTRSILLLVGALVSRVNKFVLPQAGGCKLGSRTIRPHLYALEEFGVKIKVQDGAYEIRAGKLKPAEVVLYEAGDTVVENVLMVAAMIPGKTVIKFATANYMVQDLCHFLEALGVKIEGIGTSTLTVWGVEEINQEIKFSLSEDPIEAMLFIAIAAVTDSAITIKRCSIDFLELELLKLEKMGWKYEIVKKYKADNGFTNLVDIKTRSGNKLKALEEKIHPLPYPGINIDNLPFFVPIVAVAKGTTLVHDWVYENRAIYYTELNKLGVKVILADQHRVYIEGPTEWRAAEVVTPPALRPAALILIAMLAAPGVSILRNIYSIARGYENLAERLKKLGAKIEIITG